MGDCKELLTPRYFPVDSWQRPGMHSFQREVIFSIFLESSCPLSVCFFKQQEEVNKIKKLTNKNLRNQTCCSSPAAPCITDNDRDTLAYIMVGISLDKQNRLMVWLVIISLSCFSPFLFSVSFLSLSHKLLTLLTRMFYQQAASF